MSDFLKARLVSPLLWTAYILLPAAGWGWFHGAPAGMVGAATLFAVWWTWSFRGPLPGRVLLIALLLAKFVAGSFLLAEWGLEADYFANAQWTPPRERSTEFRNRPYTRIDRRLSFGEPGKPDLPLYFFNDLLPFSATWQGYVWVRSAVDRQTFYLHGKGLTGELWVDGVLTVRLDLSATEDAVDRAPWPAGMRHLIVRVSSTSGVERGFEAGFIDADWKKTPFGEALVFARPLPRWRIVLDRMVRILSLAVDSVLLVILLCCAMVTFLRACARIRGAERRTAWATLGWLAACLGGLWFAASSNGHLSLLDGGSDYLRYETQARAIAFSSMLSGGSLYGYFVFVAHTIFGEDLFGILFVQVLLVWVTFLAVWKTCDTLFGGKVGTACLAIAGVFLSATLVPMSRVLLSENLFIPLVSLWALSMIGMALPGVERKATLLAGLSGGLVMLSLATLSLAPQVTTRLASDGGIVANLTEKVLYALGFFGAVVPGAENSPMLIGAWSAAAVGMWLSTSVHEGLRGPIRWLPAVLGLSYLLIATILFPHAYGERLILPMYILMLPYVAVLAAHAAGMLRKAEG